jgi:uncharacterized protein YecE (DUF72 family)
MAGRLYAGTSGFAYAGWSPAFYPPGTRGDAMLRFYAERLAACELNNTYYQQPSERRIQAWLAATPDSFRFAVKAHRAGSAWAFGDDAAKTLSWLARPFALFGERLGTVLFRVTVARRAADDRLERLLGAWPSDLPLTLEFQHRSWLVDEVFAALRSAGAALCVTDLPDEPAPGVHLTGSFLYLRLRRDDYSAGELEAWARRIAPFLEDGRDAYVFFKHDPTGRAPALALELSSMLGVAAPAVAARGIAPPDVLPRGEPR